MTQRSILLVLIQLCPVISSVHLINIVMPEANLSCHKESTIIKAELNTPRLSVGKMFNTNKAHQNVSKCLIRPKQTLRKLHLIKQPNQKLCQRMPILHPFSIWFSRTLANVYFALRSGFSIQCLKTNRITTSPHSSLKEKFNILTLGSLTSQNLKKGVCLLPQRKNLFVVFAENATLHDGKSPGHDEHKNSSLEFLEQNDDNMKVHINEEWFYHFSYLLRLKCRSSFKQRNSRRKKIFEYKNKSILKWWHFSKFQCKIPTLNTSSHKRLNDSEKERWYKWFLLVLQPLYCQSNIVNQNLKSKVLSKATFLKEVLTLNTCLLNASNEVIGKEIPLPNPSLGGEPTDDDLASYGYTNVSSKKTNASAGNLQYGLKRYSKRPGYVRNAGEFFIFVWLLLLLSKGMWSAYLTEMNITAYDLNQGHYNHVEEEDGNIIVTERPKMSPIPAAVLAARSKIALELLIAVVEISPYPQCPLKVKIT